MKHICVVYNDQDVEDFARYLEELMKKGKLQLDICFKPIGDFTDLSDLQDFTILVLLCSPCMVEFFDDETETRRFQPCFNDHPCVVCLQYHVEEEDISRLQAALSVTNKWKLFGNIRTTEECTEAIGSIFDILEEQTRPPPTPVPINKKRPFRKSKRAAKIIPSTVYRSNEQIAAIFQQPPSGIVQISFRGFDKIIDAKQFNDTTYIFRVPLLPRSGEVQLSLLSNNVKVADFMLKIVKPNLAAYQCLDFIAQALGMDPNDTQGLDTKLVNLFDKSVPSDGTLAEIMKLQEHELPFTGLIESDQEVPTLLHFAAKHGLEDLSCTIMDTPGSSAAFQIENKDGHDPADLAELNNHEDLAEHMRTHFETHTMVEYIHLAMDNIYSNQEDLLNERDQSTGVNRANSDKYGSTQPSIPEEKKSVTLPRRLPPPVPTAEEEKFSGLTPDEFMGMVSNKISPALSSLGSTTHDELVDIGEGVKNGEFTVDEAERLYASWVDRNKATQSKSLKERNNAINELRNQYQTVFKRAKVKQQESIFTKLKQKVAPTKKQSIPEEPTYVMQITHPTPGKDQRTRFHGRESTLSNTSSSSDGSRGSTHASWRDSSLGSMKGDSVSESDDLDDVPVQRRQNKPNEYMEHRVSLRDQFLQQIEEDSPTLPPRTSGSSVTSNPPPPPRKDQSPHPPPKDRPPHPPPIVSSSGPPKTLKPTPVTRRTLPPPLNDRSIPSVPLSQSSPATDRKSEEIVSPLSRRPPIPIPELLSPSSESKPPVKLPPKPRKKSLK